MELQRHGKKISRLVLHGGGCSSFGVYMGLFEKLALDLSAVRLKLVTSSAGSMAFLALLIKHVQGDPVDRGVVRSEYNRMRGECTLWNLLEMQGPAFFDRDCMRKCVARFCSPKGQRVMTLTFRDLAVMLPCLDVSVLACREDEDGRWHTEAFSSATTPDVLVWQACIASMSLPILFEPQVIHGGRYMDSDLTSYSAAYASADTVQIAPQFWHTHVCELLSCLTTQVPLFDRLCELGVRLLRNLFVRPCIANIVRHRFCSNITRDPFDADFVAAGEALADEFVLKSAEADPPTSPAPPRARP